MILKILVSKILKDSSIKEPGKDCFSSKEAVSIPLLLLNTDTP